MGRSARLIAVNDKPLSALDEQKEQARLNALLSDPSRQRHRKQSEDDDTARVMKVLRALPAAFTYQYAGAGTGRTGWVQKFSFKPNPNFEPPDLETQALTAMAGEIWIDPAELRVVRLEGHLDHDIDFGWGILGRLNKGGWITIDQADVGNHQWRIVRFQMVMSGRVVFKTKSFDTLEEQTHYEPGAIGLGLCTGNSDSAQRTWQSRIGRPLDSRSKQNGPARYGQGRRVQRLKCLTASWQRSESA